MKPSANDAEQKRIRRQRKQLRVEFLRAKQRRLQQELSLVSREINAVNSTMNESDDHARMTVYDLNIQLIQTGRSLRRAEKELGEMEL